MADEGRADAVSETVNTASEMADATNDMAAAAEETGGDVDEPRTHTEPRWGLFMPLFTAGFCPAKTARRTDHLSGFDSFLTHVVAWFGLGAVIGGLFLWKEDAFADVYGLGGGDMEEALFTIAFSEICLLLLALCLTPWGARRERIRMSIGRAFRRTLRHTPHAMQAFLLASVVAAPFFLMHSAFQESFWLEVDVVDQELIKKGVDYDVSWEQAREIVQSRYPFYRVYGEELGAAAYFVGGLWFLWGLLAAVGTAPPKTESEAHFPLCENCGYNLTGLSMEGRCPECGEYVADSLGPDARPGTPWQQRDASGSWDGFWKTAGAALVGPTALGRRLIPSPDGRNHRSLMVIWCGGLFVLTWLGCLLCYVAESSDRPVIWDDEFLWFFCPIASYFAALAGLGVCVGGAGVVGLLASWKHKRNMLPATMQAACAAGGFLIVWLILAFGGWILQFAASRYFHMSFPPPMFQIIVTFILIMGPTALCLPIYLWLIARIARGARFANG